MVGRRPGREWGCGCHGEGWGILPRGARLSKTLCVGGAAWETTRAGAECP